MHLVSLSFQYSPILRTDHDATYNLKYNAGSIRPGLPTQANWTFRQYMIDMICQQSMIFHITLEKSQTLPNSMMS
jgi:hypothetical protein